MKGDKILEHVHQNGNIGGTAEDIIKYKSERQICRTLDILIKWVNIKIESE